MLVMVERSSYFLCELLVEDSVGWWDTLGAASPHAGTWENSQIQPSDRKSCAQQATRAQFISQIPKFSTADLEVTLLSSHTQSQGAQQGGTHLWHHLAELSSPTAISTHF